MPEQPRIVVVGSVNVDLTFRTTRLPKPGETITGHGYRHGFGGKGANQAVMAARLGAAVRMVGRVGQDAWGEAALANLWEQDIDAAHVHADEDRPTGVAAIMVEDQGQNAILVAPGANMGLTAADVTGAEEGIRGADALLCQGEVPWPTTQAALRLARAAGVRTILNPAPAVPLADDILSLVDLCVPNEEELAVLAGMSTGNADKAMTAARQLLRRGVGTVIVTLGERGALLVTADDATPISARPVTAADTSGAGDAFTGALAVFLAEGRELADAVARANVVAGLSVTRAGTQASFPIREEVEKALRAG